MAHNELHCHFQTLVAYYQHFFNFCPAIFYWVVPSWQRSANWSQSWERAFDILLRPWCSVITGIKKSSLENKKLYSLVVTFNPTERIPWCAMISIFFQHWTWAQLVSCSSCALLGALQLLSLCMTNCHSDLRWSEEYSAVWQSKLSFLVNFNNAVGFGYCIGRFGLLLTF